MVFYSYNLLPGKNETPYLWTLTAKMSSQVNLFVKDFIEIIFTTDLKNGIKELSFVILLYFILSFFSDD